MAILAQKDGLKAHQLKQGEKHGDRGALGVRVTEQAAQRDGLVFHGEAAGEELDHLADGDGVLFNINDGAVARALQNVAEDADKVGGVGGDLGLGSASSRNSRTPGLVQVAASSICLSCSICAAFLKRSCSSRRSTSSRRGSSADIFRPGRSARKKHLALDVNKQCRGVNEFAGDVHVAGAQVFDVGEKLRRDFGDGDVVDVDVLPANEIEQQVERAVVDLADEDGKGRLLGIHAASFECGGNFLGGGWLGGRLGGYWWVEGQCGG